MMQRRKGQRAFTGLVGLPPEPNEAVVAPTPTPVAVAEPPASESIAFDKLFKPDPPPKTTAEWAATFCSRHGKRLPCPRCAEAERFHENSVRTSRANHALNIALDAVRAWSEVAKSAGISPETKCIHGHYLYEFYCDVCRLAPVDPDYDPDVYRTEIRNALKQAKKSLTGEEGGKDLRDLQQIIDIEIWKASKKYNDGMNESLAYTIADNQAGKYLTQRIEKQTIESTDAAGNAIHIPRFESMDNKPLDEDGGEGITKAEVAVINAPAQGTEFSPIEIESLQMLVATWHGEKKLVGEAMLRPGFTVRSVPGVSKSSAARVRQVVLREFKSFISKGLTK
jgi:hypothetical protein